MWIRTIVSGMILTGVGAGAAAQGFYDFGQIPGVADEPTVEVNITPGMLAFMTSMTRQTDPAAADMLEGLEGVRVRVYETLRSNQAVTEFINDVSLDLEADGWESVVKVQDEGANVRLYVQFADTLISGMTVMVVDDSEAVFINVAGALDPAQLGQLASHAGFGELLEGFAATSFAMPVPPPGAAPSAVVEAP